MADSPEALSLSAFKHVVFPIGIVTALGVARIVAAASTYIQHRPRVRYSFGHALWGAVLFLWFIVLWWIVWGFRHVAADVWSVFTLIFLMMGPALMYLATTLHLPELPEDGHLDLAERFERFGRPFFLCLAGFILWLTLTEVWLLREPWITLPKRGIQASVLTLLLIGARFPDRQTTTVLGMIVLLIVAFGLATVRATLA